MHSVPIERRLGNWRCDYDAQLCIWSPTVVANVRWNSVLGGGAMPDGKIYLRDGDDLVPMTEARYDAEDVLQALLARYPDLLAGDQMRPAEPRRWLLISREAGIPDAEGGAARWSVDHLFVDQDSIPTLVEVKRSTDTRIRREVVGQMLDYAANVVAYWPGSILRELFEERTRASAPDAEAEVLQLLGATPASAEDASKLVDEFWRKAASNLSSHDIRMVFVADVIPPELQRIVEFLNENFAKAEVLAVEVKQYVGRDRQTLVPRVIGRTTAAEDVKQAATGAGKIVRSWTEDEFLVAAAELGGPDIVGFVHKCLAWNRDHGTETVFGKGKFGPLYLQARAADGSLVKFANVNAQGYAMVAYSALAPFPPYTSAEVRVTLNNRLNEIRGVHLPERNAVNATWPGIQPSVIGQLAVQDELLAAMDDVAQQLARPRLTGELS